MHSFQRPSGKAELTVWFKAQIKTLWFQWVFYNTDYLIQRILKEKQNVFFPLLQVGGSIVFSPKNSNLTDLVNQNYPGGIKSPQKLKEMKKNTS